MNKLISTIRRESQTIDSVNYRDSFTVNPDLYSPNYFVQVGPYYFSDLQQLLNRIKYHSMPTKEELINLIEETIKQGYKLKKDENI